MRTIVFSDSHGDVYTMECILKRFYPDLVIHLGDCVRDVIKLKEIFPHFLFECVRGNCDEESLEPLEKIVAIEEINVFITHGDSYEHGHDISKMISNVQNKNVKIIMSGHTHVPAFSVSHGIVYMNPGTISRSFSDSSFGLIDSFESEFICNIVFTYNFV